MGYDGFPRDDGRQRRMLQELLAGGGIHNHVAAEVPGGAVDGSNLVFTLAFTPRVGSVDVTCNGVRLAEGAGNDFTVSGATLTFGAGEAPGAGETLRVSYIKAG